MIKHPMDFAQDVLDKVSNRHEYYTKVILFAPVVTVIDEKTDRIIFHFSNKATDEKIQMDFELNGKKYYYEQEGNIVKCYFYDNESYNDISLGIIDFSKIQDEFLNSL